MSCVFTIEAPDKVAFFEQERASMTPAEMGELFCLFLSERRAKRQNEAARKNPFESFCGTWDDAQFNEFQQATRRTVNIDDWK